MADAILERLGDAIERKTSLEESTQVRLNAALLGVQDLIQTLQQEHASEVNKMKNEIELLKSRKSSSDLNLMEMAKKELSSLAERMKDIAKRNQELEEQSKEHLSELEKLKSENSQLSMNLEGMKSENSQLCTDLEGKSKEIELLEAQAQELIVHNESLKRSPEETVEALEDNVRKPEQNVNNEDEESPEVKALKAEIDKLQRKDVKKMERLELQIQNLNEQLEAKKAFEGRLSKQATSAKREAKRMKEKLSAMKKKVENVEDLKKKVEGVEQLQKKVKELEQLNEELQGNLRETELRYTTSQNELQSYQSYRSDQDNMSDISSLPGTLRGGSSLFFDQDVNDSELLDAFVKRFPRERTLSSPQELLAKRDPAEALQELHLESTSIISALEAENERMTRERARLEAEKESFLAELAMLKSDAKLISMNIGGEYISSPNSGAINDFNSGFFPDVPEYNVTVNSPRTLPSDTGTDSSKDWRPKVVKPKPRKDAWEPPKKKKQKKKSVDFASEGGASWKPIMRRPKLAKDDSDIGLQNLTTITRKDVVKNRSAPKKSFTMANLASPTPLNTNIVYERRHTVGDIFDDAGNNNKHEEEKFRKRQQNLRQRSLGGAQQFPEMSVDSAVDYDDTYSEVSEMSGTDTGISQENEVGGDTDLPEPKSFWSFDNEKTGVQGMSHMGVPFPRIKDSTLFFGDQWKSYLMTQKKYRFRQNGFTASIFFKCSRSHLLDLHTPLTIFSKGSLRKSTAIWVQRNRKDDQIYLCCSLNCVYDNLLLKLPLETDVRDMASWHHVCVRVKGRKAVLLLDEQQPVKGSFIAKNNRNRFQCTGASLYVGCAGNTDRKSEACNFYHGLLYNFAVWNESLSLLQMKKVQQRGFYDINTIEHALKHQT